MCGICCFIGYFSGVQKCFDGIKMLQNRGYDSCGICSISEDSKFIINKYANKENISGIDLLENNIDDHLNSTVITCHTRWSTTGHSYSEKNSHPHIDYKYRFSLVHNGIIENYLELKKELLDNDVTFKSETDSEVIVNLISYYYDKLNNINDSISKAVSRLEGTWGLVIMCTETPNKIYCARHGSPLLIGFGTDYMMIVSEQSGFCNYVNNYICLNDHDLVILTKEDGNVIFEKKDEYQVKEVVNGEYKLTPDPYNHWTIKEINEQYDASLRTMGMGGRILDEKEVKLGGLESHTDYLKYIDHLILLGCGTSYNAGLYCVNVFKNLSGFDTVQIFDGAEFSRYDIPKRGKTGILMLSQSGETRDLIRCISIAKEHNLFMIGVINVVDSYIAREVQCGVYLNAGREVAVASTKAFTSQVIVLHLIATWFAQIRGINEIKRYDIIDNLRRLPLDIKSIINTCHEKCKDIAKYLYDKNSLFVLGKGNCEAVAKESSLKIKEIGYIHAEGYNSSALKHGPYSLCVKGTPIIVIVPNDKNFAKNNNIIEEVHARDGYIIGISDSTVSDKCTVKIKIPKNDIFAGLLGTIPSQLIAYELALLKGHNPDKPRGLAKVVTVD